MNIENVLQKIQNNEYLDPFILVTILEDVTSISLKTIR